MDVCVCGGGGGGGGCGGVWGVWGVCVCVVKSEVIL